MIKRSIALVLHFSCWRHAGRLSRLSLHHSCRRVFVEDGIHDELVSRPAHGVLKPEKCQ